MYQAIIQDQVFEISQEGGNWTINGSPSNADIQKTGPQHFHIIQNNKAYSAEILNVDIEAKSVQVLINGKTINVQLQDRFDALLKQMGLDAKAGKKANDIKAPMPGLVLRLMVKEGDTITKGDGLLILEAMKMENILKAPSDGVIKHIKIAEKDKVEKNQVLIQLG